MPSPGWHLTRMPDAAAYRHASAWATIGSRPSANSGTGPVRGTRLPAAPGERSTGASPPPMPGDSSSTAPALRLGQRTIDRRAAFTSDVVASTRSVFLQQVILAQQAEHPLEDLLVCLLVDQSSCPRDRRVISRSRIRRRPEKIPQAQRVRQSPRDPPLAVDALENASTLATSSENRPPAGERAALRYGDV